jgi:eukaryotic-like serine/threonine-protein kinase
MLTAGALIAGKYRVSKKLGEGAMGSVWLAKNEVTDREFAIKLLLPEAALAPTALARFLREARVCGGLRHPSILEIYDAGEAPELGGAPFLVMERLDGAALDVVLRVRGALAPRLAIDVVAQISRGLQLAHAKGIVHRDLKPANVFLHRPGSGSIEPKVLDFGISKIIDAKSPEVALTHTSALLGSPIYMSPEQMGTGEGLDARSDIHALGVLLWELLTGQPPFSSTTYNLLVVEIMKGPRPHLCDAMPSASKELATIVERAFAIEVAERFASAAAFADALEGELATMGGGVLAGRTAAVDILGHVDLSSPSEPPSHGSTTVPLSLDPGSKASPSARSAVGSGPIRSSATSFADTQVAASDTAALIPPAAAASTAGETPRAKRSLAPIAIGGGLLAIAAVAVAVIAARHAAKGIEPLSAEPSAKAAIAVGTPATPPVIPLAPPPSAPSVVTVAPSASASAHPSPPPPHTASPVTAPKRPAHASSPASAATARPRIDESGL